jgi:hypothetical protein
MAMERDLSHSLSENLTDGDDMKRQGNQRMGARPVPNDIQSLRTACTVSFNQKATICSSHQSANSPPCARPPPLQPNASSNSAGQGKALANQILFVEEAQRGGARGSAGRRGLEK